MSVSLSVSKTSLSRSQVFSRLLGSFCFVLCLFFSQQVWAGAWTKWPGQIYVKVSENAYLADGFIDSSGQFQPGTSYLNLTSSIYFEAGILPGLHFQGFLPYSISRNSFDSGAVYRQGSFSDGRVGLQFSPLPKWFSSGRLPFPMAVRALFKIPMYDVGFIQSQKELTTAQINGFPAQGDGQLDIDLWLSAGIGKGRFYGFIEAGYSFRTEIFVGDGGGREFADSLMFFGQAGYNFFGKILVGFALNSVVPLSFEDRFTKGYLTTDLSLYIPIYKGLAFEAAGSYTVWAHNSAQGFSINAGISYQADLKKMFSKR